MALPATLFVLSKLTAVWFVFDDQVICTFTILYAPQMVALPSLFKHT
jgi:hypothetical protein